MKKVTLTIIALAIVCSSLIIGCSKKSETEKIDPAATEQAQPADTTDTQSMETENPEEK